MTSQNNAERATVFIGAALLGAVLVSVYYGARTEIPASTLNNLHERFLIEATCHGELSAFEFGIPAVGAGVEWVRPDQGASVRIVRTQ
jgi:hypothetical protein